MRYSATELMRRAEEALFNPLYKLAVTLLHDANLMAEFTKQFDIDKLNAKVTAIGGPFAFGSMCPQCGRATMIQGMCYSGCIPPGSVPCPADPPHTAARCVLCRGKGFVEERMDD